MKTLQSNNLLPGDILLHQGTSWLSRAIQFFDGTPYSHASLYVGDQNVIEAIAKGVIKRNINISTERHRSVTVMRLLERPEDMMPVILKSEEYLGKRYAYEQILLLALICSVRKSRLNSPVARFFAKVLEIAASILLEYTNGDKDALICSELVYRSCNEALTQYDDPYTIQITRSKSFQEIKSFHLIASNIDRGSLVSHFYGINDQHFSKNVSPYPKDVSSLAELEVRNSDKEMEILFEDAVQSYIEEDYELDKTEEQHLKVRVDHFINVCYAVGDQKIKKSKNNNALQSFIEENSNFVTPGDLSKALNLHVIGNIK